MTELKGQALKDRAIELDIPGRSTMKAGELREAIATIEKLTVAAAANNAAFEEAVADGAKERFTKNVLDRLGTKYMSGQGTPMDTNIREENYRRMNNGGKVRAGKQARRVKHKRNKNFSF